MGAAQNKCCAAQEPGANGEAITPLVEVQNSTADLQSQPMWMLEAEEAKAAKKQKEEEAAKRLEELTAKKQKEQEAAAAAAAAPQDEEAAVAEAKSAPKKKPAAKKAAAKAAPKAEEPAKPAEKSPEQLKKEEELNKKVEEATKKAGDVNSVKYEIEVKCVSAKGLRDADFVAGTSDPYCLCETQGKIKSKFKTKTVSNKENPVWNQAAKMLMGHGDSLKFEVFDQDTGKADDHLGWCELPWASIIPTGFEGELKLKDASDTAKSRDASIKVRVKILNATAD